MALGWLAALTMELWNPTTGTLLSTLEGHISKGLAVWSPSVAWSPDGTRLATGSDDGIVRQWDSTTGTLLSTLEGTHVGTWATSVAWSPDGSWLASTSYFGGGMRLVTTETYPLPFSEWYTAFHSRQRRF
jgi:WD40 repeat protein